MPMSDTRPLPSAFSARQFQGTTPLATVVLSFLMVSSFNLHAADLKGGVKVFNDVCSECHTMKEGRNKKGPSIYGVIGRKAATIADYEYSDAMKSSNIVWTEQKLDEYLKAPAKVVPGGKMKYEGMADAEKRQSIINYLKFFSD